MKYIFSKFMYISNKIIYFVCLILLLIGMVFNALNLNTLSKLSLTFFWIITVFSIITLKFKRNINYIKESFLIFTLLVIFYGLYAYRVWKINNYGPISKILLISLICINLNLILSFFFAQFKFKNIKKIIEEKWKIFIFIIIFILLNLHILTTGFTPDSYSYYIGAKKLLGEWDFTLNLAPLQMAGHLTIGYTIFCDIGLLLFGTIGIKFIHLVLASITIFCFFYIVCYFFPSYPDIFKYIGVAIFSFSPLFLGILHGINSDFPMVCFFVWFVCCDCYDKKVLKNFCAFLLCFSKEVGVVVLGMYILGDFICFLLKKNISFFKKIKLYFLTYRWTSGIAIIFFLFLLIYGGSGWGENAKNSISTILTNNAENKILFNLDFIIYKLKEMFLLNFSWMASLLFFAGTIKFIYRILKKENLDFNLQKKGLLPIILSGVGFLMFNFLFFTYPHYRYLQLFNFYFSLGIIACIHWIVSKRILQICIALLFSTCFFIQSFYTLDPVSKKVFPTINVGKRDIVTTKKYISKNQQLLTAKEDSDVYSQVFFDSTLNNKDQLGFEKVTEKALEKIQYDGKQKLIFPSLYGNSLDYTLLAMFGRENQNTFYWDEKTKNITDNPDNIKLEFLNIYEVINSDENTEKTFYYFKYPYSYEYDEEENLANFEVLSTKTVTYNGWTLKILELKLRNK